MSTRGEELSDEKFIVTASQYCINRKRIKLKKGFLLVSCRAWDFLVGAPTGSPCKMGFYPGTLNSRCNLITCTSWFPPFRPCMAFNSIKKILKKKQLNQIPFFLTRRSDAAANIRRQGCKSLEHAHCSVRPPLKIRDSCVWAKSIAFGISTTFLRKRVLPVLAPAEPSQRQLPLYPQVLRRQRASLQSVTRGRPGGDEEGASTSAVKQYPMKVKVLAEPRWRKYKTDIWYDS